MAVFRSVFMFVLVLAVSATAPLAADGKDKDKEADPSSVASTSADTPSRAERDISLTIASWGGAYAKSQELAFIEPFRSATGAKVELVSHGGDFAKLKREDSSQNPAWDVVDLGLEALEAACNDGLLERFGTEELAVAGEEAPSREDFLPGALHDCGVATMAWSSAIAFDREAFEKGQPKTAADFFDVEKFPGNRAVPGNPKYLLPLALMADGVAPGDVYRELESEDGLERALTKLETLRNDIVWWQQGDQPLKLLVGKSASMAIAFSGRIFYAIVRDNQPFGVIWDGQVYDLDMWAVPKGSPNREAALKFIAFSLQPERLAAQTKWFPYGPMRKSAVAKVGRHAVVDVEMGEYLPTSEDNFKRALKIDPAWWAKHAEKLTSAFEAWMVTPAAASAQADEAGADADDDAGKADDTDE